MEPQTQNMVETKPINPLFQVTRYSKYLALLLFIILPFIGAWVGYQYALSTNVLDVMVIQPESTKLVSQPELISDTPTQVSESEISDSLEKYSDSESSVEFTYPKAKIDILSLNQPGVGSLVEILKDDNGVTYYNHVTTLSTPPEEISVIRSYVFKIYPLNEYIVKNTPAGYEYRYDAKTNSLVCMSRINAADGYNPCTELSNKKVAKTETGSDIYLFESGDGGYATKSYAVVLPSKNAIISFSTYMTEYYDGWLSGPVLDSLMQDVLKSVK
jgi:hypothetical protein